MTAMSATPGGILEGRYLRVRDLQLFARVGERTAPAGAPAVVLVHGAGASSRYMVPVAEELAPHCRVHVPDLPGFGASDKPRQALDVPGLADALAGYVEAAELGSPAFLGNSMGCQVIADLAARYPERAGPLVLQGPTTDPKGRSLLRQWWRRRRNGKREPPSLGAVIRQDYRDCGWWRLFQTFRHALRDRLEDKLPRVRSPALVVWGTLDGFVPRWWAEEVARLLPRGRLAVVEGAPHTMNYSRPVDLAHVVLPFLREHCPAPVGAGREEGETDHAPAGTRVPG